MEQWQFLLEKVFFQVGFCRIVSLYFFVNTPHLLSQSLSPLRNIYKWGNANCNLIRSLSLALSRKERLHTTSFPSRFCALGYAAHTCVPTYWMNPQREFCERVLSITKMPRWSLWWTIIPSRGNRNTSSRYAFYTPGLANWRIRSLALQRQKSISLVSFCFFGGSSMFLGWRLIADAWRNRMEWIWTYIVRKKICKIL